MPPEAFSVLGNVLQNNLAEHILPQKHYPKRIKNYRTAMPLLVQKSTLRTGRRLQRMRAPGEGRATLTVAELEAKR